MKKNFLTIALLCVYYLLPAQTKISTEVEVIKCSSFSISKPLSELIQSSSFDELETKDKKEVEIHRIHLPNQSRTAEPGANDAIAQQTNGTKQMAGPIANWQALSGSGYPPDPSGAASANYYFQAVNTQYRIFTKTGGTVTNGGPFNLSTLWAGSSNAGDPIVLYDKYADRWFISQFNDPDKFLIAVSTSPNPLGTYYTYTFIPSAGQFPDYPKFSIWSDGYYFTTNVGSPYKLGAMDRTKMLAGDKTATMISLTVPATPNAGFFAPLPADADGQLPPNGTPCPAFTQVDDTWSTGGKDQLRIFKIAINWTTPANSAITLDQTLLPTAFNVDFDSNWDDIPQPNSSQKLDAINGVLMFRAQYRRWTGYNSVVIAHSVIVNTTTKQSGIRWYELRQNSSTNVWSIYQQGTYAPDTDFRWMGSISMDDNGSIGLGYAVSNSSSVSPSLRYTGRNSSDQLGKMTFVETSAIVGSGAQGGNINRFGDYSHTSLDPDGITFWHTGEYFSSGNVRTRVFSFQIPYVATGINDEFVKADMTVFQNENILEVKGIRLPNNTDIQVDLFDINGKEISSQVVKPTNNSLETIIPIFGLSKGVYLVRIGNLQFQKVKKVIIN